MRVNAKDKRVITNMLYEWSTHGVDGYYDRPNECLDGIQAELDRMGLAYRDGARPLDIHTPEGRGMVSVVNSDDDPASESLFYIVVTWYKMQSGRWEMLAYPTL